MMMEDSNVAVMVRTEWQRKDYITLEEWPTNRNFTERKNKVLIPKEEILNKYRGWSDSCGHINLHELVDHRGGRLVCWETCS